MIKQSHDFEVIIIGGGAAGTFCAIHAAKLGLNVAIIEQNATIGNKIRISGGGRCNHTNLYIDPIAYLSSNPDFCRSALARFSQWDFLTWYAEAGLTYHEKTLGQLFCDQKSRGLIAALTAQCEQYAVRIITQASVSEVSTDPTTHHYIVHTNQGTYRCHSLVIACGGPSFAKLGGSDLALRLAKQFHLANIPFRPALVPFTLAKPKSHLSGISTEVIVTTDAISFREQLLFTHRGLSGPAILQISSYWQKQMPIIINLLPDLTADFLIKCKRQQPKQTLYQALKPYLPQALLAEFLQSYQDDHLQHFTDKALGQVMQTLQQWRVVPSGTEGMTKAEVSTGGIDTREINPRTFAANNQANLYAIGEALDVTGWLGGYNFQWAWSSAWCCAQALANKLAR